MTEDRPAPPATIDLDAARARRREQRGPAPSIRFLGKDRALPYALPAEVIDVVAQVNGGDWSVVTEAVKILLGGPVYEEIVVEAKAAGEPLELEDVTFLLDQVLEVYGVTLPKSRG